MSKVVFITGISSGFGRAMAIELTNNGHKVYGSIRSEVDPILEVNYVRMDVTDISSVVQAVIEIYDKEGCIDVLINNAATKSPNFFAPRIGKSATLSRLA